MIDRAIDRADNQSTAWTHQRCRRSQKNLEIGDVLDVFQTEHGIEFSMLCR